VAADVYRQPSGKSLREKGYEVGLSVLERVMRFCRSCNTFIAAANFEAEIAAELRSCCSFSEGDQFLSCVYMLMKG
jgi:hypothetical protein